MPDWPVNTVIDFEFVIRPYIKKRDAYQLVGQAKRRTTKIFAKAVGGGISAAVRTSINVDRK